MNGENQKNDNPFKHSKEQLVAYGRRGGVASGESRRNKNSLRELLAVFLSADIDKNKLGNLPQAINLGNKNITAATAMAIALVNKAMKGDVKAFNVVRDTLGEKNAAQNKDLYAVKVEIEKEVQTWAE